MTDADRTLPCPAKEYMPIGPSTRPVLALHSPICWLATCSASPDGRYSDSVTSGTRSAGRLGRLRRREPASPGPHSIPAHERGRARKRCLLNVFRCPNVARCQRLGRTPSVLLCRDRRSSGISLTRQTWRDRPPGLLIHGFASRPRARAGNASAGPPTRWMATPSRVAGSEGPAE